LLKIATHPHISWLNAAHPHISWLNAAHPHISWLNAAHTQQRISHARVKAKIKEAKYKYDRTKKIRTKIETKI
jgi:hypothetical protein